MSLAFWALGITGGLLVLNQLVSPGRDMKPIPATKIAARGFGWVEEEYATTLNNPLYTKNRFAHNGRVTSVAPGDWQIPQYEVTHAGMMTRVYRMPTAW